MADKTTGDLQAVPVGDLPLAPDIYDDTLIPVEQGGEAKHMTGAQWKAYGVAAAKNEADRAELAVSHYPKIQNGTWWVWDATQGNYVDTGSDATVTADSIKSALGYTPADEKVVRQLSEKIGDIDLRVDGGVAPRDVYDPNTNTVDDAVNNTFLKSDGGYTTHVNYFTTGKIYIEPETTYTIHGEGIVYTALSEKNRARAFSKNDIALTPLVWGMDDDGNHTITTPPEADYIRISVAKNQIGYSSSTELPDLLAKFNDIFALTTPKTTFDASAYLDVKAIHAKHLADDTKPLYGKTIVTFGDSIFENYVDRGTDVSTWLKRNSGATVINCAFGGCRMGAHKYPGWDSWSMYRLADSVVSGDWSVQDNSLVNYPEQAPSNVGMVLSGLKGIDFKTVDIVTISYGTNDWSGSNPIDNTDNEEDTSTFLGALRYSIRKLLTAYPQLSIVLVTPFWRCEVSDGVITNDSDGGFVNDHGQTVAEYASKEIETAKALHIPIWDSYHTAGFNRMTWETYFDVNDGTHFNIYGRQRIAKLLQKQIELYAAV